MLKNKNCKLKKQIPLLLMTLLVSLLVGCRAALEGKVAQPASAEAIANGDVENGWKLFMGYSHFEHEGPPCMGCHSAGENNGILGGGALGPDLTNISSEWSDAELASILSNYGWTQSPVMEPIYNQHPLTESEQADLIAFMKSSVGESEPDKELLVLGISILATIGTAIVLGFIYRNRLRSVRRVMVEEAESEIKK